MNEKVLRQKNYETIAYGDVKDGAFDLALQKRMMHGYMACVSYVDAQLGRVMDELDRLGIADHTAIVLIGDHGFHLGDHGLWGKFTHLENAARCPLIVVDPENPKAGSRISALTEFVDIYPTFCDLAGLPVPRHCEGSSLAPLLNDPSGPWKQAVFTEYHHGDAWGTSMRTERYRYTKFISHNTGGTIALSLYDLKKDPDSNVNVAYERDYQDALRTLDKVWESGWQAQQIK
jgi:arylsulfatase A-like enzyme